MTNIEEIIKKVKTEALENHVPIVRDKTLEKIMEVCRENKAENILEIGTATGYSALNFLSLPNIKLDTIEKNKTRFDEAKTNFENAKVSERVTMHLGDAGIVLQELSHKDQKYDFIFLDGPKGQYIQYLPYLQKMLCKGGVLFADNILLGGLIKDESRVCHKNRAMFNHMKDFLNEITSSPVFETQIFEIDDGFAICKKK